ncbi:piezo-type mechanosensitive ion channel component 1-like [Megaptera novaeangliae]
MTALIKTNHTEFWKFHLHPSLDWPEIVNPLILLLSYYTLVLLLPQRAPQPGAWRLSYTSWLGFVLLLWACVLWRSRSHRRLALRSSPFLVGYANLLALLIFVVGLRASQEGLFPGVLGWHLTDLDLKPYLQPCLHLGAKASKSSSARCGAWTA